MNLSQIVLFVYNRLDHTKQTIEALQKNELANQKGQWTNKVDVNDLEKQVSDLNKSKSTSFS